jgi:hypothetical protein
MMRDLSVVWSHPVNRTARVVAVMGILGFCIGLLLLWVYASDLNAEIQQANQRADLERQCAKALETWVHRQVAPSEAASLNSLGAVKDQACRTHVSM